MHQAKLPDEIFPPEECSIKNIKKKKNGPTKQKEEEREQEKNIEYDEIKLDFICILRYPD